MATELYKLCQSANKYKFDKYYTIDDKAAASNDLRKDLEGKLSQWTKAAKAKSSASLSEKHRHEKLETAGANEPVYMMYWTNEDLLTLIAKSLVKT